MEWIVVAVGLVLALAAGGQIGLRIGARRRIGRVAPASPALPARGPVVVYFHSPTCGPCRAMRPAVEALTAAHQPVVQVDVSRDPATALAWDVLATPTTVLVRDGVIAEILVGAVPRPRLEALLDQPDGRVASDRS